MRINVTHIPTKYKPVWIYPTEHNRVFSCIQTWFWEEV